MSRTKPLPEREEKTDNRIWFGICFVLGIAVTLFGQKVAARFSSKSHRLPASLSQAIQTNSSSPQGAKGPWGILEYQSVPLEDPGHPFPDANERMQKPRWVFENVSPQQLAELLLSCDFTPAQKSFLLDTNHWEPLTNGICISPTDEFILGLGSKTRQCLYPILARWPENYAQCFPFRFPLNSFDARFAQSGLPPEKIELIRNLTYTNDGLLCFTAVEPVKKILSTNEFDALIHTLYSIPTWRVRLRLDSDANLEELLKYWGRGGRAKTVRPLLESLARSRPGDSVGIPFFFPAFARLKLYTYPDPNTDPEEAREDCFYTSLNFFNERPDPKYLNPENNRTALQTEYILATDQPKFGDLIALINPSGGADHICVYIADDIVFTKNGINYLQPWVLMKIPDMLAYFPSEHPWRMVVFRRKDL